MWASRRRVSPDTPDAARSCRPVPLLHGRPGAWGGQGLASMRRHGSGLEGAEESCMASAYSRRLKEGAMEESEFEGTLVLEQLAAIGRVEDFFDAIDSDDVARATLLMKEAKVDAAIIALVVRKIKHGDAEH